MKRPFYPVIAGLVLLVGCSHPEPPAPEPNASAPPAPTPSQPSPADALDRLDTRASLPLLPMMAQHQKQNMRDHLLAVQEIVAAVATNDFAGVAQAARRIGTSDSMQQMCTHMGAGARGFTEQALAFHQSADRITAAARDQARDRVLTELATTLQACTSCHATWKQKLVDESSWQHLGAPAPPPG